MTFGSSIVMYLMLGAGIAAAIFVREGIDGMAGAFRLLTAGLFWPLYVPVLLSPRTPAADDVPDLNPDNRRAPTDSLSDAITRVEAELDGALRTLDGWTEGALSLEAARIDELKHAWRMQAERIRELAALLDSSAAGEEAGGAQQAPPNRVHHSEQARRENINRLRQLHDRMRDDLLGTLSWVRELVTLIHLAKYTGAPSSRAAELVAQIAAAVEGLSEVSTWQSEPAPIGAAESRP